MAAIYCADIYCNDCADFIRKTIAKELFDNQGFAEFPDGWVSTGFDSVKDIVDYLDSMDEGCYDSDAYPKDCSDDEESDGPQHCSDNADCINAGELSDGFKYGYFFGNKLTRDGEDYVKEAVRDGDDGDMAREVWAVEYSYLDFNI
tara:strand:+ start:160 stop:597 length:438 start_codon:yes stop_codon:yes gene_type:complete